MLLLLLITNSTFHVYLEVNYLLLFQVYHIQTSKCMFVEKQFNKKKGSPQ